MKINPINNYQINRNQKAQAKSNPNFEGVKFVLDKKSPSLINAIKKNRNASDQEILNFKNTLEKCVDVMSEKINTEISSYVGIALKSYFNSRHLNAKIIPGIYTNLWQQEPDGVALELLAKNLWPQETEILLTYDKDYQNHSIEHCLIADGNTIYRDFYDSVFNLGYYPESNEPIEQDDLLYLARTFCKIAQQIVNPWYHMSHKSQQAYMVAKLKEQPEYKAFIQKLDNCIALRKSPEEIKEAIAPWFKLPID